MTIFESNPLKIDIYNSLTLNMEQTLEHSKIFDAYQFILVTNLLSYVYLICFCEIIKG